VLKLLLFVISGAVNLYWCWFVFWASVTDFCCYLLDFGKCVGSWVLL